MIIFEMFIEGDARLWYLGCMSGDEISDEWTVPEADMKADYDKVNEKNTLGLRELFLKQFTPTDYLLPREAPEPWTGL